MNSKLPNTGTSIFTTMSRMAAEHNAINLSQGFPDFNAAEELIDRVNYYLKAGFNQYAPMPGLPKLREKISEKIKKAYGRLYNPETEITITAGATQAIFTAITAVINKGDEAILIEPAYDSYAPSVSANNGIPIMVPLNQTDYTIQWDLVKEAISSSTKMIILNSPHNPTGGVISGADLNILEELTRDKNIFILSDEVYEHIVFDNGKHFSISKSEELAAKSFVISSFGKTYHTTGWKLGYCAAPEQLMNEFRKLHQFVVFSVNTPIQHAYADYLNNENHYLQLGMFYQKKRNLMLEHLKHSRFSFTPASGTYFQLLNYSQISDLNDYDFASYLTKEIGVAVIPLSPFYSEGYSGRVIRICFAKRDEVIIEAGKKLSKI